jgi:hypothetical protein
MIPWRGILQEEGESAPFLLSTRLIDFGPSRIAATLYADAARRGFSLGASYECGPAIFEACRLIWASFSWLRKPSLGKAYLLRARLTFGGGFPFLSLRLLPGAKPARSVPCAKWALPFKKASPILGRPGLRPQEPKSANLAVAFLPSARPRRRLDAVTASMVCVIAARFGVLSHGQV